MKIYKIARLFTLTTVSLLLAACPFDGGSDEGLPAISISNVGDAEMVETPDISIRLYGTAKSDETVTAVSWKNDRGGAGVASGTENWATGVIRLESGENKITLTAKDTLGNENTKSLIVERKPQSAVASTNRAPTITGTAASKASVDVGYEFRPVASDPEDNELTFSIDRQPSWTKFDSKTGRLYGVPGNAHVGTHANIKISVSDGENVSALAPFAITVVGFASGSATLTWNPPTRRTDNTALNNDLAGYQIEYSLLSGDFDNVITLDNAGMAAYVVENLAPGTWKFGVRAFDNKGQLSARSGEGQKTVR